jgi:hypothetical protein
MIAEVSEKLLGQFVDCLEGKLATQLPAPVPEAPAAAATGAHAGAATAPTPPPVTQATPEPEALDLMELAGGAVAKRVVPLAIGVAVVAAVVIYLIVR